MIIDFLHDDHLSLLASSLICRSWNACAKHHLFQSIAIPLDLGNRVGQFLEYLEDSPDLKKSVRSLTFRGTSLFSRTVHVPMLRAVSQQLYSLKILELDDVSWSAHLLPDPSVCILPSLDTLVLRQLTTRIRGTGTASSYLTAYDLFDILRSFRSIRRLDMFDFRLNCMIYPNSTSMDTICSLGLEQIRLCQAHSLNLFFNILIRTRTIQTLQQLHFKPEYMYDIRCFHTFLVSLASSGSNPLSELTLAMDNYVHRRQRFLGKSFTYYIGDFNRSRCRLQASPCFLIFSVIFRKI